MKVKRVTLEIEIPARAGIKSADLVKRLRVFVENWPYASHSEVEYKFPCQVQILSDVISPNTQIGSVKQWPPK